MKCIVNNDVSIKTKFHAKGNLSFICFCKHVRRQSRWSRIGKGSSKRPTPTGNGMHYQKTEKTLDHKKTWGRIAPMLLLLQFLSASGQRTECFIFVSCS